MIIKKIEERMNLSLGSYSKELSTVRTGRANPKMLDGVRVEVYGQKMPISQLATVSIPEPQMINYKKITNQRFEVTVPEQQPAEIDTQTPLTPPAEQVAS